LVPLVIRRDGWRRIGRKAGGKDGVLFFFSVSVSRKKGRKFPLNCEHSMGLDGKKGVESESEAALGKLWFYLCWALGTSKDSDRRVLGSGSSSFCGGGSIGVGTREG
jgi:hypothetical protein